MIFISIIIALVLDRVLTQFHSFRQFEWLQDYAKWLESVLSISRLPVWVAVASILIPIIVGMSFLNGIFTHDSYLLFELAFNVAILYLCLGPLDLNQQIDDYLHAIDTGDQQIRFNAGSALNEKPVDSTFTHQISQIVDAIFSASLRRVYACLFWFVMFGAIGAVFYRVVEQGMKLTFENETAKNIPLKFAQLLAYLEWIPARMTLIAFMLGGNYEGAFSGYTKATSERDDIDDVNKGIITYSGRGAIQYEEINTDEDASKQVKKARGLVLRSLVVWLVFCLLVVWL